MELLERADEATIGVAGDLILDRYAWGDVSRISPEAPVPVIHVQSTDDKLGGAGNSAQSLAGLETDVTVFGRVGNDPEGQTVRALLNERGIDLFDLSGFTSYPTTVKTRYIADSQHLLRVDEEKREPIQRDFFEEIEDALREQLEALDALLISDYGKGVFSPQSLPFWLSLARDMDVPVVVDPVVGHFEAYRSATLLTPNDRELREGLSQGPDDKRDLLKRAGDAVDQLALDGLLVTQGADGMTLVEDDGVSRHLDTEARDVYDVTGAGDTVAAMMALGEALETPREQAMELANTAAGYVVGQMGTIVPDRSTLREELSE